VSHSLAFCELRCICTYYQKSAIAYKANNNCVVKSVTSVLICLLFTYLQKCQAAESCTKCVCFVQVLFNFNWLHAKLSCMPLQSILTDFDDLLSHSVTSQDVNLRDVILLADALRLASSVLSRYSDMLAPQVRPGDWQVVLK